MKILYITGCTHSGSTLVARLLNQHERIFAAGELQYLDVYWGPTARRCSCGEHALRCPVWSEVFWKFQEGNVLRPLFSRLSAERPAEWRRAFSSRNGSAFTKLFVKQNLDLFRVIAEVSGAEVILDSSKNVWRLLPLWRAVPERIYVLHLLRSPEGQIGSRIRRSRRSFWRAALGEYLRVNLNIRWLFAGHARYRKVRHEDLVARPEETLRGIAEWLGIDYQDPFTRPLADCHDIGGNPWTKRDSRDLRPDPARVDHVHPFSEPQRLALSLLRRICY